MKKQVNADIMLVLVTLCWGASYYLMDLSLEELGPFMLNAFRFIGAFLIASIFAFSKLKSLNRETLKYSILAAAVLVVVYIGATFGVKYTSISNSGFLCALTVVFVPLIEFAMFKKRPERKIFVAVLFSLIGIMLLTLKDDFSINTDNLKGDLLCIMCAVAYAVHLLVTEKAVNHEKVDAFHLGVLQLGITGVFMLVLALIFEAPAVPQSKPVILSVIFLSVFCTGVAYIVQSIAQQYTKASHVGIIFTLEPVFAGIFAFFVAGDVLSARAYFGAVLMISALFITEINFKKSTK